MKYEVQTKRGLFCIDTDSPEDASRIAEKMQKYRPEHDSDRNNPQNDEERRYFHRKKKRDTEFAYDA